MLTKPSPTAIRRVLAGALTGSAIATGAALAVAPASAAGASTTAPHQVARAATAATQQMPRIVRPAAFTDESVIADAVRYRTQPNVNATILGLVNAGTPVEKLCWAPGSGIGWYKVNIPGRAAGVFIAEQFVSHLHSVPNC